MRCLNLSAIGLMMLEAARGTELVIQADGEDEIAAVDTLVDLVESRFGETAMAAGEGHEDG